MRLENVEYSRTTCCWRTWYSRVRGDGHKNETLLKVKTVIDQSRVIAISGNKIRVIFCPPDYTRVIFCDFIILNEKYKYNRDYLNALNSPKTRRQTSRCLKLFAIFFMSVHIVAYLNILIGKYYILNTFFIHAYLNTYLYIILAITTWRTALRTYGPGAKYYCEALSVFT